MKNIFLSCLLLAGSGCHSYVFASDIRVSQISLVNQNVSAGPNSAGNFVSVRFNLAWDYSWRTSSGPANWDAAWVFIKYRVGGPQTTVWNASSSGAVVTVPSTVGLRQGMGITIVGGSGQITNQAYILSIQNSTQFTLSETPTVALSQAKLHAFGVWEHATISTSGHQLPAGASITVSADQKGCFIYRSTDGSGNIQFNQLALCWLYGLDGVRDHEPIDVQVFAIEMVYVPTNAFNVGGGGGTSAFTSTTISTATATTIPTGTGSLGGQAGGYPTGVTAPGSASWPNGFQGFYCMKYELSQGQYRDFLNSLTRRQQSARILHNGTVGVFLGGEPWSGTAWLGDVNNSTTPLNRIGVRLVQDLGGPAPRVFACDLTPSSAPYNQVNQSDDGEWVSMGFLNYTDLAAFLDWAALRPMTELEFEKACRGNQLPVSDEFAWGTTVVEAVTGLNAISTSAESHANANANAHIQNQLAINGPIRSGNFASATSSREKSGASYYGIMDLSGGQWERAVTLADATGRSYTGNHGDGNLSLNGAANTTAWPGLSNGEVLNSTGCGFRGGAWIDNVTSSMRVSDRLSAGTSSPRSPPIHGGRGVRTQP